MNIKREKIRVYEMTCNSCENRVEKAIKKLTGVNNVMASYSDGFAVVEYDTDKCSVEKIKEAIKKAGYSTQRSNDYKFIGMLVIVAAIVMLGLKTSGIDMEAKLKNASYLVLFVVGALTSIHCVGMCGGIMISQSIKAEGKTKLEVIQPALLYNLGRVISYTLLGGIVGALGSVVSMSIVTKAIMQILAGVFMIMMGFNMAGFKAFRKFNIHIKLPSPLCNAKTKKGSPIIVGILNGLMPCGPLQTMQLFALGTGSAVKGASAMFMFAIGTVPLMLVFGAISGILSKGYTKTILKTSGVLVIILGLIMGNRGFALAGINLNPIRMVTGGTASLLGSNSDAGNPNVAKAIIKDGAQTITMNVTNNGWTPNAFYVQKGIPVKWIINGNELNTCNNAMVIKSLNKEVKINKGENIVEFTPKDTKDINFSCWMGMMQGVIKVVDKIDSVDTSKQDDSLPPASNGPSCCAAPLPEGGENQNNSSNSIYGSDLSKVSTEILIKKATPGDNFQTAAFKGINNEFQPLVYVIDSGKQAQVTFDLSEFINAASEYQIIDITTGNKLVTFNAKQGINTVQFTPDKIGGYAVIKNGNILGVIEVTDDLKNINIEVVRNKYIADK